MSSVPYDVLSLTFSFSSDGCSESVDSRTRLGLLITNSASATCSFRLLKSGLQTILNTNVNDGWKQSDHGPETSNNPIAPQWYYSTWMCVRVVLHWRTKTVIIANGKEDTNLWTSSASKNSSLSLLLDIVFEDTQYNQRMHEHYVTE